MHVLEVAFQEEGIERKAHGDEGVNLETIHWVSMVQFAFACWDLLEQWRMLMLAYVFWAWEDMRAREKMLLTCKNNNVVRIVLVLVYIYIMLQVQLTLCFNSHMVLVLLINPLTFFIFPGCLINRKCSSIKFVEYWL
jgi:hypothetical protein